MIGQDNRNSLFINGETAAHDMAIALNTSHGTDDHVVISEVHITNGWEIRAYDIESYLVKGLLGG